MANQNSRKTGTEQYYTPLSVAKQCLAILDEVVIGEQYLEPAGGTGKFLQALEGRNWISYDIEPKFSGIQKTEDFLSEELQIKNVVTITNPPFGRANSLSVPFFNKCAEVSTHIGFLVPKSWRKWSVIDRLDPRFHLVRDVELACDFDYPEQSKKSKGKLNTVFQVWEKRKNLRPKTKIEDRKYISKSTPAEADVAMTAFGRGCGTVLRDFPRVPNTTKMFLKIHESWVYQALDEIDFSVYYNNVAFIESLSLKEVMHLLNQYYDSW